MCFEKSKTSRDLGKMAIKQNGRDDLRDGPDQGGFCQFAGGLNHPQQGCSDDDVGAAAERK